MIVTYANTRSSLKPYWNPKPYTVCPKYICKQLREMNKLIWKSNQMTTFFLNLRERLLWAPLQKLFHSISNEKRRSFEMFRCLCFFLFAIKTELPTRIIMKILRVKYCTGISTSSNVIIYFEVDLKCQWLNANF